MGQDPASLCPSHAILLPAFPGCTAPKLESSRDMFRLFGLPPPIAFQVLKGEIEETRYSLAPNGSSNDGDRRTAANSSAANTNTTSLGGGSVSVGGSEVEGGRGLVKTSTVTCSPGTVTYIEDSMGLHKMENPSPTEECISLHLYSPGISECTTWADASSCVR